MNYVSKKLIASLLAGVLSASTCLSISASASVIGNGLCENSTFQYTVITEKGTYNGNPNSLKMTIRVTNNPGIYSLCFGVEYHGNCKAKSASASHGLDNSQFDEDLPYVHLAWLDRPDSNNPNQDYFGDLEFVTWFEAEDAKGNDITAPIDLQISVGLTNYASHTENYSVDVTSDPSITPYPVDTIIPANSSTEVMLGDVNNNDSIDQLDAYTVLQITSYYNSLKSSGKVYYKDPYLSVNNLNSLIVKKVDQWDTKFDSIDYAEIADVNFDNLITDADAQAILTYHSNAAVGNIDMDSVIGKPIYVNVQA